MTQATILASGTGAATSSDITLVSGESKTVGLFATGNVPPGLEFPVMLDTPGDDVLVASLSWRNPATVLSGPGTFRIKRQDISAAGVSVGVFTEG